jgi:hypothetical protein
LTAGTNIALAKGSGVTGFNDITAANIWDTNLSAYILDGKAGGYVVNASTKSVTVDAAALFGTDISGYTTGTTAGHYMVLGGTRSVSVDTSGFAPAIWGAAKGDYNAAGTMGNAMNAAASAGDPWATELLGAYTGIQAGNLLNLIYKKKPQYW